ncbi:glycosyltransferase family 4 protein [Elioraea tepidiphila]|jgi:glycosyltransferase involved in cell wall biosynthesis|uniref:glycosyltransferase family 4 protein n=1 Tax=Elioraea tepidiphila TaxID=457934 RepID=UPI000379F1DB|nr:glycosyltransferase family 4 protein [Elioraea tepidiphila]
MSADSLPPAVLQVLPMLETGGVERGTIEVAEALVRAGFRALVASAGGRLVPELTHLGVEHIGLPLASKDPWVMWRNATKLAQVIREHRIDIVHARSRAPAWSARLAVRRTGARWVTTYHGTYNEGFPLKRRYNAVMASGERVIAISAFIAEHLIERHGTDPARVRIIPRGVDPRRFDPAIVSGERIVKLARAWRIPDDAPVVLLPGRLTRWKGQELLIEALGRMARRDAVAVLAGDDQGRHGYRARLEVLAERLGLGARVRIVGDCPDMPAALMLADVAVSASIEPEAFGRVVVEAQAMGRPVVVTAHGGALETVSPGETGLLVPPGDAAALATALDQVLSLDEETRAALGARAREAVLARYTTERMCAATLDVYRELL